MSKTVRLIFVGGLFFILDQVLKYFSRDIFVKKELFFNLFGWFPFKNYGVAFGIPLPSFITITISLVILFFLIYLFKNSNQSTWARQLGLILIIFGAASNLIDRIFFNFTTDYLLILTGVVNLADIMIVCGFGFFVFTIKRGDYVFKT